jgi:SAM-dependent methyltransferase
MPGPNEVIPSPNIWRFPQTYEIENRGVDPDGVIEAAIREIRPWDGATVLDIGCGSGFHLPRFAAATAGSGAGSGIGPGAGAARVIGVEPHPPLVQLAGRRVAAVPDPAVRARIEVRAGTAQRLPVETASIDVVHARWAYFFGPGCEPGLAEIRRVLRPGGAAFVIDNDATRSTFGGWFRRGLPSYDPVAVERFWSRQGWSRRSLDIRWELPDRADFEAVVRIEFAPELAARILAEHPGRTVDYAVNLFWLEQTVGGHA